MSYHYGQRRHAVPRYQRRSSYKKPCFPISPFPASDGEATDDDIRGLPLFCPCTVHVGCRLKRTRRSSSRQLWDCSTLLLVQSASPASDTATKPHHSRVSESRGLLHCFFLKFGCLVAGVGGNLSNPRSIPAHATHLHTSTTLSHQRRRPRQSRLYRTHSCKALTAMDAHLQSVDGNGHTPAKC